ncbi:hypothetical protein [Lederbergia citrea]|uniref:hypothetical protein n=1 Tax=Lederbergia citrea TaxID=2833581 RepID=UPI001BC9764F|nr:hypothetical protein [Lederbergia citrea]MBS4178232.1 hypothetical protein [Lederbergia citrea]
MLKLRNVMVTLLQGCFEYLLLFPFIMIIGLLLAGSRIWLWLASILVLFFLGALFKTLLPNQKWWVYAGFSVVVGVITAVLFDQHLFSLITLAFIHPIFIYRGMMYTSRPWNSLIPITFMWFGGFGIYFVSYFVYRFVEKFSPYLTLISICGALTVVIILFISNSEHLKASTLSKQKKPFISRTIKKQNRVYLALTIAVIALITNGQMIRDLLWSGFKGFIQLILGMFSGGDVGPEVDEIPPPASMDLGLPVDKKKSAFAEFLDLIMTYFGYILFVLVVVAILLLLIRKIRLWVKQLVCALISFLQQMVSRTSERDDSFQYIDEKESIFDWKEWKKEQQDKAKGFVQKIFKREPRWESLSNQQKVRFVYRTFLSRQLKNMHYKSALTPRETVDELKSSIHSDESQLEKLLDAYERTRYGEQDVEAHKIKDIYSLVKEK